MREVSNGKSSGPDMPRRIVIVDDDAQVLDILTLYLRSVGFGVTPFSKGIEFLTCFDRTPLVDCIVSDVRMPEMDGLALLKEVRRRSSTLPVIFLTGHANIPLAVESIKAGANEFLEKPVDPHTLERLIKTVIDSATDAPASMNDQLQAQRLLDTLSPQQSRILDLVASGMTSKEIALNLSISHRTVETHRAALMHRLHARSLADLLKITLRANPDRLSMTHMNHR